MTNMDVEKLLTRYLISMTYSSAEQTMLSICAYV